MSLKDFEFLRVKPHHRLNLRDLDPGSTRNVPEDLTPITDKLTIKLGELQELLYAEGRRSLLVVLQGLDASGKDGTVRHVFDDVNPHRRAGHQFQAAQPPKNSSTISSGDATPRPPPRGTIGVFNRSYYEDILVVRVHADKLLAPELRDHGKKEWPRRFNMIRDFEQVLSDGGTQVVKFFLHISKEEQRKRFIKRQEDPAKHWKLAAGDFEERKFWNDYQEAYEEALPATSTEDRPVVHHPRRSQAGPRFLRGFDSRSDSSKKWTRARPNSPIRRW